MSQGIQKWLRFITPAIILVIATWLLGKTSDLWNFTFPSNIGEWSKSIWALLLGLVYYLTPVRNISNKPYFDKVSENLRSGLLRIAGNKDNPGFYTWEKLRPIFWHFVDNDNSLTKKSSQAYFNGYLWTSVADCRAISFIFMVFSWGIFVAGNNQGAISAVIFLIIGLATLGASKILTQRHMAIGNEQLEIIAQFHRQALKDQIDAIPA